MAWERPDDLGDTQLSNTSQIMTYTMDIIILALLKSYAKETLMKLDETARPTRPENLV